MTDERVSATLFPAHDGSEGVMKRLPNSVKED
jgi:hypothetical protein